MKNTLAALAIISLAGCVVPIPVPSPEVGTGPASRAPVTATTGFTQTLNAFRASQGLGAVQQSPSLSRAADLHAADMVARNYFSHQSPGGPNGNNLMQRAASSGCAIRAGAENIAQGQQTAQDAFESWRTSPGHRANMLGSRYTAYGLGRDGDTWVLMLSSGC